MSNTATPPAAAVVEPGTPARKSRRLIVIVAAAVIVVGGGAAAFFMMRKPVTAEAAQNAAPALEKAVEPGVLSLEPFTVNLADGGSHYLRLNLRLLVGTAAEAEKIQKNQVTVMRLRSAILELLAQQTAEKLVTPEGKAELKQAIAEQVKKALEDRKVVDVLFSDFVVQF
jgi:flagellar FliL protein